MKCSSDQGIYMTCIIRIEISVGNNSNVICILTWQFEWARSYMYNRFICWNIDRPYTFTIYYKNHMLHCSSSRHLTRPLFCLFPSGETSYIISITNGQHGAGLLYTGHQIEYST
jgi:hypothetical protein